MKRFLAPLLFLLLLVAIPVYAQDNSNLITLNDATPAIDVVINLPPDSTGAIALNIAQAAITLTDSANTVVFHAADTRIHAVELNIAPNSGSHTLTVERLPGMSEAYVNVTSLAELTAGGTVELITGSTVTVNESIALTLDATTPGGTAIVSIPAGTTGVVTAAFPGAYATTQLVDADGVVIAESVGGHVDGLNIVLDAGNYEFMVLGSSLTETVVAGVRVVSAEATGVSILEAPAGAEIVAADTTGGTCTATVAASSINLRSGPGTGYSVSGYGYLNENYTVGGRNPENNWIVVATSTGSAWLARTGVNLQGRCDALTVFNIPLQDAQITPVIITTPSYNGSDDDEHEHEEHEDSDDDEGEHEEGDDD